MHHDKILAANNVFGNSSNFFKTIEIFSVLETRRKTVAVNNDAKAQVAPLYWSVFSLP